MAEITEFLLREKSKGMRHDNASASSLQPLAAIMPAPFAHLEIPKPLAGKRKLWVCKVTLSIAAALSNSGKDRKPAMVTRGIDGENKLGGASMEYKVMASRGTSRSGSGRETNLFATDLFTTEIEALNQACTYLAMGIPYVRIETMDGDAFIEGNDLAACCRGEKNLTADLKAN
jgi:hypothetical protein